MRKNLSKLLIFILILGFLPLNYSDAADIATRLKGLILLQVESNGEAWYVNPDNEKRYYLGRPADAFILMKELGIGIKHNELQSYLQSLFPKRLSGKILLDVENNGEAYYIFPEDLKGYYLGRPADAFGIMKNLGLGITNANLNQISILSKSSTLTSIDELWNRYCNNYFGFCIDIPKKHGIYNIYKHDCGKYIVNEYSDKVVIDAENKKEYCREQCYVDSKQIKTCEQNCLELCGPYWTFNIARVKNEADISNFMKEKRSCDSIKVIPTDDKDVFTLETDCYFGGGIHFFYYPKNNIFLYWSTGQDSSFSLPGGSTEYLNYVPEHLKGDSRMIESFEFIK